MVRSYVSLGVPVLFLSLVLGCSSPGGTGMPSGSGGGPGSGGNTGSGGSGSGGASGNGGASGSGGMDASGGAAGNAGAGGGGGMVGSGGAAGNVDGGNPDSARPEEGPIPTRQEYLATLYKMSDLLISTQILQTSSRDYGALVSPGINPDRNPTYSRAAEAVYPLAVAFKHSQQAKYADAAVKLGNWLFTIQNAAGAWGEEWPLHDGWDGTSADQLISLSGAYEILKGRLTPAENTRWVNGMTRVSDWIVANFPKGNVNYFPTGSVALVWAHKVLPNPKAAWLTKAASLMVTTLQMVNSDGFITGEGNGVDLGYNIAQSIGMIALYGKLLPSPMHVDRAATLLKAHYLFMYPNGAIDNSWGTRTFKWTLESGTKTAPGIYFSFGLVADKDPTFQRGAQLALNLLRKHYFDDKGWVVHGPHAFKHPGCNPPSSYSTFARAQSIATVIELGPETTQTAPIPSEAKNWFKYFPTVKVGLLRTDKVMATLTAYGEIGQYARESVVHGGSVTALWFEGYGPLGFLQVSSQTRYVREEPKHMPTEGDLLPLTPRIETNTGTYATNLFDNQASLTVRQAGAGIDAVATGALRTQSGAASGTTFTWTHQFAANSYSKEVDVSAGANIQIVEPFVDNPGNRYELMGTDTFRITTQEGKAWELKVVSSSGAYQLIAGTDRAKHWMPFPAFECYPLVIRAMGAAGAFKVKYTISQVL